eukprot:PhM_4_TR5239/c0_g2_i1/m.730
MTQQLIPGLDRTDLGGFGIKSAAELELQVNVIADHARQNFDKAYADRMAGFIVTWEEKKHRLAVTTPIDHPTITIDCGAVKFDYTTIPKMIEDEIVNRETTQNKTREQQRPISVKFKGVDYSNIDKVVANIKDNTVIERLSLAGMKLEPDDAQAIAQLLQHNKSITALDLSDNKFEAEGVNTIGQALQQNRSVTDLDLGANELGKAAMKSLAPHLEHCALQRLQLNGNKLGIYGMEELAAGLRANATILALGVYNNNLGADGLKFILDLLESEPRNLTLTEISLGGNRADECEHLDPIKAAISRNNDVQMLKQLEALEDSTRKEREEESDKLWEALVALEAAARKEVEEKVAEAAAAKKASAVPPPKSSPAKAAPKTGAGSKQPTPKPAVKSVSKSPSRKSVPAPPVGSKAVKAATTAKRAPSPKKSK